MSLKVEKTPLDGVLQITPPTVFEDFRGHFIETYNRVLYNEAGIDVDFVQDDISVSRYNVLRGIHGDDGTWKLVSCHHGSVYLVVLNNIPDSPQYRKWTAFTLSDRNRKQVLIPPRFGNGHLVLTEIAIFNYKQSAHYDRPSQFSIAWNDPEYGVWWPHRDPILSQRDQGLE